jgi:hypothetical protein
MRNSDPDNAVSAGCAHQTPFDHATASRIIQRQFNLVMSRQG